MILTIVGARPQFVKAAALSYAISQAGIEEELVHTGQHYDARMSDLFFSELGIPGVKHNLGIGSGSHGRQTGEMLIKLEPILLNRLKDIKAVLVYGDTNSTLAGALCAVKLHIPVFHVEAGLRSFNWSMPEEINRIMTDHISHALFCSSVAGVAQLKKEGIVDRVFNCGDIMQDAVNLFLPKAKLPKDIEFDWTGEYNLVTIHRPANTDDLDVLEEILMGLGDIGSRCIWPVHPRNSSNLSKLTIPNNVITCPPLSYLEMLFALSNCTKVITDSGGLQKEAYWLKKPCVTVRPETEWIETIHNNWNKLADPARESILNSYNSEVDDSTWIPLYGDGNASHQIVKELLSLI